MYFRTFSYPGCKAPQKTLTKLYKLSLMPKYQILMPTCVINYNPISKVLSTNICLNIVQVQNWINLAHGSVCSPNLFQLVKKGISDDQVKFWGKSVLAVYKEWL